MSEQPQPPIEPTPTATPVEPVPAQAPVWYPLPSAEPQPASPTPVTGGAPAQTAARPRRTVTPALLVAAIVGTAVLTSGGTYLAVNATSSHSIDASKTAATTVAVTPAPATTPAPAQTTAPAPVTGQNGVVDVVKAVSPAVVTITAEGVSATNALGQSGTGTAIGSGVIFDSNGLILTNHHVVAGNPSKLTVTLKDGRTLDASIYGIDTMTDLAIVKVAASGLPTAQIGDSSSIQVGQEAIAIGSPLGEFTDSVTSGIVSALGRSIDVENESLTNLIQTDTAINPGNSGGPLLDASGKVVGINTAVAGDSQGIGFAIPIDIAKPLLHQASAGQQLARAWLGVRFETIDAALKQQAGLPVDKGAWIPTASALQGTADQGQGGQGQAPTPSQDPFSQLFPNGQNPFGNGQLPNTQGGTQTPTTSQSSIVAGGPAATAGLAEGDIITSVDGTALDATHTLDLLIGQMTPGQSVQLTVLRNGQTSTVIVTLGTRPQAA